jgi:flagellar hook-associated protein 3 FlgL
MRIATNNVSDTIIHQLQALNNQQTKLQNQVGSGLRITQPEDDPAAMARVLGLNSESRALGQFVSNTAHALELSRATYSGLQQIKKVSDRATEIGTLGTGAQNAEALQAYAAELDQLIEQVVQLANSKLGNVHLFGGTATDAPPYAVSRDALGRISQVTFNGNEEQGTIPLSETSSVAPGADAVATLGIGSFLGHLISLRGALEATDADAIATAQIDLLRTEDIFISALAQQGAVQMRIEVHESQQADRVQNIEQLISSETSTDLTATVVKLSQAQTAYQAALQSASMIMKQSLLDYIN